MTQITHPELVRALLKPGNEIADTMTADEADLWHNATGVMTEATEIIESVLATAVNPNVRFDRENLTEELGDLEFYIEGVRQRLEIERNSTLFLMDVDTGRGSMLFNSAALAAAAGKLLDRVKKVVIYKKPVGDLLLPIRDALAEIEQFMHRIRTDMGITRSETITGNIAKLSVRYAGLSYSDSAAQERADKATPHGFADKASPQAAA